MVPGARRTQGVLSVAKSAGSGAVRAGMGALVETGALAGKRPRAWSTSTVPPLMMAPPPWDCMAGIAAWLVKEVPFRLIA